VKAALAQATLPFADPARDPTRCPRCGRAWPGVFVERGMDLGALLHLDREAFEAVVRCWVGGCCGEGR